MIGRISNRHRLGSRAGHPVRGRLRRGGGGGISCKWIYSPSISTGYHLQSPADPITCSTSLSPVTVPIQFTGDPGNWQPWGYDPNPLLGGLPGPTGNYYNVNTGYYGHPKIALPGPISVDYDMFPRVASMTMKISDLAPTMPWFSGLEFPTPCVLHYEDGVTTVETEAVGSDEVPLQAEIVHPKVPLSPDLSTSMILDSAGSTPNPFGERYYYNSAIGFDSVSLFSVPLEQFDFHPYVPPAGWPHIDRSPDPDAHVLNYKGKTGLTLGHGDTVSFTFDFVDGVLYLRPRFQSTTGVQSRSVWRCSGFSVGSQTPVETVPKKVDGPVAGAARFPSFADYHTHFNVLVTLDQYNANPTYYDGLFLNQPSPRLTQSYGIPQHAGSPGTLPVFLGDVTMHYDFEYDVDGVETDILPEPSGSSYVGPTVPEPGGGSGYIHDGPTLGTPWQDGTYNALLALMLSFVGGYSGSQITNGTPAAGTASMNPATLTINRVAT